MPRSGRRVHGVVRSRDPLAATIAGLLVMGLAACTGSRSASPSPTPPSRNTATVGPIPELARYYAQRPAWTECEDSFQCASVSVPVDYADASSGDIQLKVARLPASDPAHRLGSLVLNPGGPGLSGVEYVRNAGPGFAPSIRTAFDLVGFDPRGVGASAPISCISARELDAIANYDGSPDNPAEESALLANDRRFAHGCAAHSARLLAHVSTRDAARDLDVIRAALGDATLTYLGASYGTYLGAVYADLFPTQVGRMVLDGAEDPSQTPAAQTNIQVAGLELALTTFLKDCVTQPDCPLGSTPAAARARLTALVNRADAHPLASDSGRRSPNRAW